MKKFVSIMLAIVLSTSMIKTAYAVTERYQPVNTQTSGGPAGSVKVRRWVYKTENKVTSAAPTVFYSGVSGIILTGNNPYSESTYSTNSTLKINWTANAVFYTATASRTVNGTSNSTNSYTLSSIGEGSSYDYSTYSASMTTSSNSFGSAGTYTRNGSFN